MLKNPFIKDSATNQYQALINQINVLENNLKTLTNPIVKANTTAVNPKVTPKICGIVFFIPKLKPE